MITLFPKTLDDGRVKIQWSVWFTSFIIILMYNILLTYSDLYISDYQSTNVNQTYIKIFVKHTHKMVLIAVKKLLKKWKMDPF
jgi:hypothetical protein